MNICNNNDQTCFSDTLTSARPPVGRLNPRLLGSGFNTTLGVQQMLMRRKTCLIPILKLSPTNIIRLLLESQDRGHGREHGKFRKNAGRSRCCVAVIIIGVILLLAMGVGLGLYFGGKASNENVKNYLSNR